MELVILENNEPVTTSLIISGGVNTDHNSVIKLIRKYKTSLERFGTCRIEIQKTKGRDLEFYYLNERQTTFLITCMRNTDIIIEFKIKLVEEFYKMKNILSQILSRQDNPEWKEIREFGKETRRNETYIIDKFLDYAISQGSEGYKNKKNGFSNITKMENKALFIIQDKFPNIRQILTGQQLQIIASADQIVEKALKEGMEKAMFYKDIYKLAKERIEIFSEIIPKTTVPMIQLEEKKETNPCPQKAML